VVLVLGTVAVAGVLACAQAPFLVLLARHPVAFALPQAVDPLWVGAEALPPQEIPDSPVAVAGVPADELLHAREEPGLVIGQAGLIAQGGTAHGHDTGRPAFGDGEGAFQMIHGSSSPRRA